MLKILEKHPFVSGVITGIIASRVIGKRINKMKNDICILHVTVAPESVEEVAPKKVKEEQKEVKEN